MRELADEKARAERARQRFESRSVRLLQEKERRELELAEQKDKAMRKGPDAIREILERSRAKDHSGDET
jgi:hypothetical protein